MIGASIFTMLGLGAKIAGHNLPLAFVLSGLLAFLVGYSYANLGSRIVSNAGPIEFIIRGIGDGLVTGALAILMWFSYVVSIALFAKGFAGYFLPLLGLPLSPLPVAIVEVLVVAFFTALNFFGAKAVGRAEFWIVLIKVSVLLVFIVLGIWTVNPEWITPRFDPASIKGTLFAAAIFFLSYMGFGLVTNASEDIENPEKNVPLAIRSPSSASSTSGWRWWRWGTCPLMNSLRPRSTRSPRRQSPFWASSGTCWSRWGRFSPSPRR